MTTYILQVLVLHMYFSDPVGGPALGWFRTRSNDRRGTSREANGLRPEQALYSQAATVGKSLSLPVPRAATLSPRVHSPLRGPLPRALASD